jgi:hypothetical protein
LSVDFGFGEVAEALTPMSKVMMPLPDFHVIRPDGEDDAQFVAQIELEAEKIVGSYSAKEHEACVQHIPNGGWLPGSTAPSKRLAWHMRRVRSLAPKPASRLRRKVKPTRLGKLQPSGLKLHRRGKLAR